MIVSSSDIDRIMYLDPKGSNWNRAAVLRRFLVDPSQIVPLGKGLQVTANAVYLCLPKPRLILQGLLPAECNNV